MLHCDVEERGEETQGVQSVNACPCFLEKQQNADLLAGERQRVWSVKRRGNYRYCFWMAAACSQVAAHAAASVGVLSLFGSVQAGGFWERSLLVSGQFAQGPTFLCVLYAIQGFHRSISGSLCCKALPPTARPLHSDLESSNLAMKVDIIKLAPLLRRRCLSSIWGVFTVRISCTSAARR